jgi:DNA modification methylase
MPKTQSLEPHINRIIYGDAMRILKRLPSCSVDLVVTDPPYGDNTAYGWRRKRIFGNEHPLVALAALSECYRLLKKNASAYMFCGARHLPFLMAFFSGYTRFKVRDVLVWNKLTMGLGYAFRKQYECILVLEKGKPRYRNTKMLNLLSYRKVRTDEHPHVKPLPLIKSLIEHSSDPGDVVLDPFLGSGTTALAARQLGRRFIGVEIDWRYCRIASEKLRSMESHMTSASTPLPQEKNHNAHP